VVGQGDEMIKARGLEKEAGVEIESWTVRG
jgi:hypothetical protein